jgi:putative membrane protein
MTLSGLSRAELRGTRRPAPALLRYYLLTSIAAGPALIVVLPMRIFRYRTLRYDFDEEGMTARWGILFRREISLTYARIQDIHLVSNVVERWLGLGRVEIQTASGQSAAELTIEGLPDFEQIRDELYMRMRGNRADDRPRGVSSAASTPHAPVPDLSEVVAALGETAAELRAIRALLTATWVPPSGGPKRQP